MSKSLQEFVAESLSDEDGDDYDQLLSSTTAIVARMTPTERSQAQNFVDSLGEDDAALALDVENMLPVDAGGALWLNGEYIVVPHAVVDMLMELKHG